MDRPPHETPSPRRHRTVRRVEQPLVGPERPGMDHDDGAAEAGSVAATGSGGDGTVVPGDYESIAGSTASV